MGIFTCIAIYLTIWWTVLFAVLPLGVTTHAEAGIDKGDGGDPGAPVFAVVWSLITFHLVSLPDFPKHVY
jgi:predicted secreted protein